MATKEPLGTLRETLRILAEVREEVNARFSVQQMGLFGSLVRGEAREDSDVDVLVVLGEPTFDNYMDLKFFLEETLGRSVDLVMRDSIKPRVWETMGKEVVYVENSPSLCG